MTSALEFLNRVAEVSAAFADAAGVGGVETAGQIISCLAASPENLDRFMVDGAELILDGTIGIGLGGLSWHAADGRVVSPSEYRKRRGVQQ